MEPPVWSIPGAYTVNAFFGHTICRISRGASEGDVDVLAE
jgi:hypothetical protein